MEDEGETEILLEEVENNGFAGSECDGNLICSVEHSTWTTFNPNDGVFEGARGVKRFSVDLSMSAFPTATVPIFDLKPRTQENFVSIRKSCDIQIDYYSKLVVLHKNLEFPYVLICQKGESEAVKALSRDLPSILVQGYSGPLQSCGKAQRNSVFAHQLNLPDAPFEAGADAALPIDVPVYFGPLQSFESALRNSVSEYQPEISEIRSTTIGETRYYGNGATNRSPLESLVLNSETPLDVGATSSTGSSLPVPDGEILTAQVLNTEASLDGGVVAGPSAARSLPVPDGEIRTAQSPSQPPGMLGSGLRDLQIFGIRRRVNNVAADQLIISSIDLRPRVIHPIGPNDMNDVFGVQLREVDDVAVGLVAAAIDVRINNITDVEPAFEDYNNVN